MSKFYVSYFYLRQQRCNQIYVYVVVQTPNELKSDELLVILEDEDKLTTIKLTIKFNVDRTIIERGIRPLDYVVKFSSWVSPELSFNNKGDLTTK